ncbi:hypothetical protein BCR35DRAFT_305976 [Leucosporidium creatinivorum]|uniref:chitin deacetylase n=1 Tax=Leucosporidium creatinivorum TaxID=106004 RepID=A0A1Y2EWJ8_9BASI|nr:hypothetical protein BCR35DRAFT_305976 [Leucosporidium creatinivorum]
MVFAKSLLVATAALTLSSTAVAHMQPVPTAHLVARQAAASSATSTRASRTSAAATSAAAAATTAASGTGTLTQSPLASLTKIGTATTSEATQPLPTTFTAGATPPVSGAPALPAITALNPADFPALDVVPPIDSDLMKQWIAEARLDTVPDIPVNGENGCSNTTVNAQAVTDGTSDGNCWWTCGGCTRATDISFCPTKADFGLSFDDGPSPYTPRLLNLLASQDIQATFFIVGSRAISRPEMVQTEYMLGHQLSVHTWAHSPLTTLSNEEIVAELAWTRKVLKDITGVTPNTMRPPYGDIDDRVRAISLNLGLRPVIWTTYNEQEFDTEDWKLGAGTVNATTAYNNIENFMNLGATEMDTGFIVLEHDLYQQSVDLAVSYILPQAINEGKLKLLPVNECLGESKANAYIETSDNKTAVTQTTATVPGASGTGFVAFAASTGGSSSDSSSGGGSSSSSAGGASSTGSPSSNAEKVVVGSLVAALVGGAALVLA